MKKENRLRKNSDDEDMFVTLELDNGRTVESKVLTIFDAQNQDYIVLMPLKEDGSENDDGDVYIYRYFENENGDPTLDNIQTDEEYEIVADRFDELLDEAEFEEMS